MDVTTLSTKGQIVIPEKMRKDIPPGSAFVVSKVDNMFVLKPVLGLTEDETNELKELNAIWSEIDSGKADAMSEKEFFESMKEW